MSIYIFDLDGTLANIDHRLHYLDRNDWDGFFQNCDLDAPIQNVIQILLDLSEFHEVQIWSGRSAIVEEKTLKWLDDHIKGDHIAYGGDFLRHMRKEGDYRPDTVIKEEWLYQFHQERGFMPTMIFDDRQSVVDMWRKNGVTCAQVATWADRKRMNKIEPLSTMKRDWMLTLMVGPSGAGKSTFIKEHPSYSSSWVVSSDQIRQDLCGDFKDQSRNKEVFQALHAIVETRLKCGLPTVVDATNINAKDRKSIVDIALDIDPTFKVTYLVIDAPLEVKKASGGWRNQVMIGDKTLVEAHHERFQSALKDIMKGDGYANVSVSKVERIA